MPSPGSREGANGAPAPAEAAAADFLPGKRAHRLFVAAVLALTLAIRLVLVSRGGQYFFYDEGKFGTSRDAAALLARGHVREALVFAIEPHVNSYADHIGFKLFGIVPQFLELRLGGDDRISAGFFSVFSSLNVLLLAAIAGRLAGSRRAFDLTLVAGALSATLLIYSRFLVPYDLSLCFALLAIWIGVRRPAGYLRSVLVGSLSAWAFFCYYGYWQIAGIAVLLHALWLGGSLLGFVGRVAAAGAGFGCVVLGFVGLSHLGAGTLISDMVEITKYQAVGAVDFRSGLNTWAYLYYAEGAALFLWVGAFGAALWAEIRGRAGSGGNLLSPLTLVATGFLLTYAIFVVDSDLRQHLVVHGRHSRQLMPFLILGFGLGLDRLCGRSRQGRTAALAAVAVLSVNAVAIFAAPFAQEFPRDFKVRAEAVLRSRAPITDGSGYYRLVNVDHFIYEPEILRAEPVETLLASKHPLEYLPFLYEGESREMKRLRRSIDHRMRLVRMEVPEASRMRGEPYGMVTLKVQFPGNRAGYKEPLLAIGPRGAGDLFFVNYLTASTARLGFESIGGTVLESEPFPYEPGATRTLQLFSGTLMPNDGHPVADKDPAVDEIFRQKVYATLDGSVVLEHPWARHDSEPWQVFAGVNTVEADSAGDQFWGTILSAERGGWPPRPKGIGKSVKFGPVHLRIAAPPVSNGTAEPVLTTGIPGKAVLCYMRVFPDGSVVFGLEIWGVGIVESRPLHPESGTPVEAEYSFGSLFPARGSPDWGEVPPAEQDRLLHTIRITVDGATLLEVAKDTPDLAGLPVYFGKNPIGGSVVNEGFSGKVLLGYRAPFGQ